MIANIYKVLLIILYSVSVMKRLHTSLIKALKYVRSDHAIQKEIESKVKLRFPNEVSDDPDSK